MTTAGASSRLQPATALAGNATIFACRPFSAFSRIALVLSGVIANHALAGGRYTVRSGFWGLIAAIQTPGAPPLQIINTGANAVAVVWPTTQTLFSLQENTDLNTTNWVSVAAPPTDDGTNNTVIISPAAGNRFFRLKWP